MNYSIATADGNTHFKIGALALGAVMMFVVVCFSARRDSPGTQTARLGNNGPIIKAGMPTQFTRRSGIEIR
jgi:hypothetical protein